MKLKNIYLIFIKEEKNCRNSSFSYWLLYYYGASLQAEWTENPWLSKMIIVFVVPNKYGMKDWTTATRVVEVFFHNKTNLLQLSPRCSFACPSFLKILCNKYMTFKYMYCQWNLFSMWIILHYVEPVALLSVKRSNYWLIYLLKQGFDILNRSPMLLF